MSKDVDTGLQEDGFLEIVLDAKRGVTTLDSFKKVLPSIPTPQLVAGYLEVNDFYKNVDNFRGAIRSELVGEKKEDYNGRLMVEGKELEKIKGMKTDEKGHRYIDGVNGRQLKVEKREGLKLDEKAAEEFLRKKGYYVEASVANVKIKDGTDFMEDLRVVISQLESLKDKVEPPIWSEINDQLKKLKRQVKDNLKVDRKIDETKLDALATLGLISAKDAKRFYKSNITYALKEQKKKK